MDVDVIQSLNKINLENRIRTFIGYGNLEGNYWFIGYEEGCSDLLEDIRFRLTVKSVQDIYQAHKDLANNFSFNKNDRPLRWFGDEKKFQRTWGTLIKILLIAKGYFAKEIVNGLTFHSKLLEEAKDYQATKWGRENGKTLVADLLPLPSSSSSKWNKGYENSDLDYLKSRSRYTQAVKDDRINLFKKKIEKYKPRVIIAYGKTFWKDFKKLASSENDRSPKNKEFFEVYDNVILIEHPARGISNEKLIDIGCWIRKFLL